jgi:hypothetical protein
LQLIQNVEKKSMGVEVATNIVYKEDVEDL